MIPESFVQQLLDRVDIADVVGRYVQLRKGGANLLGLCPFHNEKSPSFTVSPTKQFYHCFGCGAHGTAISFLIEHTGASFPEAVRSLAQSVGMVVPEEQRSAKAVAAIKRHKEEVSRHQQVLEAAQRQYLAQLKTHQPAVNYLKQRGLTGEIAARFGLGWSGTDRRGLAHVFPNYEDPVLIEAGLVIESEDGRRYDRFRERVMFPIRNARGHLIGFGGRIIGKGEPKYLNSPETPLFSKGQELYGLWEGRNAIRREGAVIVVEGYMDVVGLAQLGIENAVATLGTATTAQHVQKLFRVADKVIFSFDGDKAGRRAAWRALQACLPLLRDDVSVRFLFLPPEHDPDSYVREFGADAFKATLVEAPALSRFMLDELCGHHEMNEPEGRAACIHEAKPLLAQLPAATALRIQIEREFARRVQLTPEELAAMLSTVPDGAAGPVDTSHGDEPPGFMDHYAAGDEPVDFSVDWQPEANYDGGPAGAGSAARRSARQGASYSGSKATGQSKGRRSSSGGYENAAGQRRSRGSGTRRSVTPMAKRLLRLLLVHPELVDSLGDQQLETLTRGPHLSLVRELIGLISSSGARHVGALLQAAEPDTDLAEWLATMSADILSHEDLPDPVAEWNDAMHKVEIEAIKAEQSELIAEGLTTDTGRQRYQQLAQRLALLCRL